MNLLEEITDIAQLFLSGAILSIHSFIGWLLHRFREYLLPHEKKFETTQVSHKTAKVLSVVTFREEPPYSCEFFWLQLIFKVYHLIHILRLYLGTAVRFNGFIFILKIMTCDLMGNDLWLECTWLHDLRLEGRWLGTCEKMNWLQLRSLIADWLNCWRMLESSQENWACSPETGQRVLKLA